MLARISLVLSMIACMLVSRPDIVLARTWSDASGLHKIEGEFVKLADGKVDIRCDNGKLVRILLEKLSEADQQFVGFQVHHVVITVVAFFPQTFRIVIKC